MTKDTYFDMCDTLGTEPQEDEIPLEVSDLPIEAMQAWYVYERLPAQINEFSGSYLGKDIGYIPTIMDLLNITDDRSVVFQIILIINNVDREVINRKIDQQRNSKGHANGAKRS